MKREELDELYGCIYSFTDVAGDSALELMDDFIESEGLQDVFDRFLNELDLTVEESVQLANCFELIIEECEFEFGEYEDED